MSDKLATQIAVLETEMKNIAKKVDEGFENNSNQHKDIMLAFEKAMEQKASKWVEDAVRWFLYAVAGSLVTLLIGIVIWSIKSQ